MNPAMSEMRMTTPPELPEGYFVRVGPGEGVRYSGWGDVSYGFGVSIRQTKWYGSKVICQSEIIKPSDAASTVNALIAQWYHNEEYIRECERVSGDYPPRRWKEN